MMNFRSVSLYSSRWKMKMTLLRNHSLVTSSSSRVFPWDAKKKRSILLSSINNIINNLSVLTPKLLTTSSSETEDVLEIEKDPELNFNPALEASESEKRNELVMTMKFLRSRGFSKEDIKNKYAKYIDTHSSYYKILLISDLHPDISLLLPLMSLSLVSLKVTSKQAREDKNEIDGFPNRIAYLSHHLEISPEDLIADLTKHSSLLTMQFYRLRHKMNILKDANISPKYIAQDLWIFNYNEKLLVDRIVAAREAEVELKPWMLRCSEKIFESMLIKNSETQRILNGMDEISYLAKKLDCSKDYVEYIMEKNKLLKSINIPKLEQVLTFLYEKGYTPQEVRLFPRVFCSSLKTLNKKYTAFQNLKSTLPTISQLCISTKKLQSKINKQSL